MRWIILAALFLPAATPLAAQGELGVKLGLTFGDISNKGLLPGNLDTRNGVAGGLSLGLRSGVVGMGVDALYAQRGLRSSQSLANSQTRLDYLDLPVYLKVTIPTPGIRPFGYAGPQVSWELKCRRANGTECGATVPERPSVVYAGVVGAGVRFGGRMGLSVEGRYVYGLTDLKLTTLTSNESFKHRTFMLLLAVGL
ncbi:MAG: porin family protein [Gemmatimonadales bacterium]